MLFSTDICTFIFLLRKYVSFFPELANFPLTTAFLAYQVLQLTISAIVDELLNACWWRINYRRYRTAQNDILHQTRNYTMTVLCIQVFWFLSRLLRSAYFHQPFSRTSTSLIAPNTVYAILRWMFVVVPQVHIVEQKLIHINFGGGSISSSWFKVINIAYI